MIMPMGMAMVNKEEGDNDMMIWIRTAKMDCMDGRLCSTVLDRYVGIEDVVLLIITCVVRRGGGL
jgi:hypothetical protein